MDEGALWRLPISTQHYRIVALGFDVVARRQAVMPVPGTDQFPPDATITQAARAVLSLSNLSNLTHTVVCRLLSAVL